MLTGERQKSERSFSRRRRSKPSGTSGRGLHHLRPEGHRSESAERNDRGQRRHRKVQAGFRVEGEFISGNFLKIFSNHEIICG